MTIAADFDKIDEYLTSETALEALSSFTKTSWVKDELFDAVVRLGLPAQAVTPPGAVVGIRSVEVNGTRRCSPSLRSALALLCC
jgi:hypothetical protein